MLQQKEADDFVLATGETHSVREFIEYAAQIAGFNLAWKGEGLNEEGIDKKTGKVIIKIDPEFYRPAEVDILLGSAEKAKRELNWKSDVNFKTLVEMMMEADLKRAALKHKRELTLID